MGIEMIGAARIFFRNGKDTNFFYAVEKTDFSPKSGALTEIVGRSGSGKTTLLNMLGGLLTPTEGRVLLDGEDLYAMRDAERSRLRMTRIGIVPQGQTGLSSLTVLENVLAPAAMCGQDGAYAFRAKELLKVTGIGSLANVYSNELSGGELRRMSIARALVFSPSVILADEPTSDLDPEASEMVWGLFKEEARRGSSVIVVTHERDAGRHADEVFRMEEGVLRREE